MSISSTSIFRPVSTLMFFIGITVLGVIAFANLSVDFLPAVKIPRITVQTSYQDVSPEEIEMRITQPLEEALGTVAGVKNISSVSREGMSIISVEFFWGTDMDFAILGMREKLDKSRTFLPREASRPTILRVDPATEPIMGIAIFELNNVKKYAHAHPKTINSKIEQPDIEQLVRLKETANALIKRRIEQVAGVAQASVLGGLEREIHVNIDVRKLQALGLSLDEVSEALSNANINLPGGTIKSGSFRYSLRTLGEFTSVDEINGVIIGKTTNNRPIRIVDIGFVEDGFKERVGLTRYNGNETIVLQVRKEAGANTITTSAKIRTVLEQLRTENPNLQFDIIEDQAEFIDKSINDVLQAIILGAILAFLVLFFFLRSPKYPVIISLATPISILATFEVMYFFHISLNIISLTGLALGIGMLGDNAIMVVENVSRLREKGMNILEAALEGSKEINLAVTASTLTNVAIFLPIIFVKGVASQLFIDMGVTMTISLLVSLLVAASLVPMLLSHDEIFTSDKDFKLNDSFSKAIKHSSSLQGGRWDLLLLPVRLIPALISMIYYLFIHALSRIISQLAPGFYATVDWLANTCYVKLEKFLTWALENRYKVILATLIVFLICLWLAWFIPSEPAPDIDQSRFHLAVQMPKGTSLDGTLSMVKRLENEFGKMPYVNGIYSTVGITEERNLWTITKESTEHADLEFQVSDDAYTQTVIEETRKKIELLKKSINGVEFSLKRRGTTFEQILRPATDDIKIRVVGKDPETAFNISEKFIEIAHRIPGLVDIRSSLQRGNPEYQIIVDRERASQYGISVQSIAQHVAQQTVGKEATVLSDFDRKITIRVQPMFDQRKTLDDILSSTLIIEGNAVPLRELVRVEQSEGFSEIWRENQQRVVMVVANVNGTSVSEITEVLNKEILSFPLTPGYTISIGGENEEIQQSFRSLFMVILLSLFLVYMILAAEYESILYPLVIILTSPLAFIGAIIAMIVFGQQYNVMSLVGMVIMIGAVDNDAVIVVDIITSLRRQGVGLTDAVKIGMKLRMRPILMTTSTAVLGVIPLVVNFGNGSELVRALTIPLAGGLISSTLFTVVAIPIVYTFIDKWALGRK